MGNQRVILSELMVSGASAIISDEAISCETREKGVRMVRVWCQLYFKEGFFCGLVQEG